MHLWYSFPWYVNGNLQGTFNFGSNTCFIGIARHSFVFGPTSDPSENCQTLSFYTESGISNHLLKIWKSMLYSEHFLVGSPFLPNHLMHICIQLTFTFTIRKRNLKCVTLPVVSLESLLQRPHSQHFLVGISFVNGLHPEWACKLSNEKIEMWKLKTLQAPWKI